MEDTKPGDDRGEAKLTSRKLVGSFFTRMEPYHALQAADLLSTAKGRGFEVEVLDAEENSVLQIHQLFKIIHGPPEGRPLALVAHTRVPDGLERVARSATAAGIGWILLNRSAPYLDGLRREHPQLTIAAVTSDNQEIGRIQALQFRTLLPRGGSLLYVQGPPEAVAAQMRLEEVHKGILGAGIEMKVVAAEWTEASGEREVGAWLRLKTSGLFRPGLVGCQNDALALGARKALRAHHLDWAAVPFTGCDGLPDGGQRMVDTRQLEATIVVPSCSGLAVDLIDQAVKTSQPPPAILLAPPRSYPPVEKLAPASSRT